MVILSTCELIKEFEPYYSFSFFTKILSKFLSCFDAIVWLVVSPSQDIRVSSLLLWIRIKRWVKILLRKFYSSRYHYTHHSLRALNSMKLVGIVFNWDHDQLGFELGMNMFVLMTLTTNFGRMTVMIMWRRMVTEAPSLLVKRIWTNSRRFHRFLMGKVCLLHQLIFRAQAMFGRGELGGEWVLLGFIRIGSSSSLIGLRWRMYQSHLLAKTLFLVISRRISLRWMLMPFLHLFAGTSLALFQPADRDQ